MRTSPPKRRIPGDHRLRIEHTQGDSPPRTCRAWSRRTRYSPRCSRLTRPATCRGAEARLGPAADSRGAYAWRTMFEHHIPVAGGSDFPVEQVPPILGIYAAVTRQGRQGARRPEGLVSCPADDGLSEAIEAFTHGAAYAEGAEDTRGVNRGGAVTPISRLYSGHAGAPTGASWTSHVDYTIVDGEIVYPARGKASP